MTTDNDEAAPETATEPLIGSSFRAASRVFAQVGLKLSLIYLLCTIPAIMAEIAMGPKAEGLGGIAMLMVLGGAGGSFASGGIVAATVNILRDDPGPENDFWRNCMRFFIPMFIAGLCLLGAMTIGLVLLIIPGFIVLSYFLFASPAIVIEEKGPLAALERSMALGRGRRFEVFWFLMAIVIIYAVVVVSGALLLAQGSASTIIVNGIAEAIFGAYTLMLSVAGYLILTGQQPHTATGDPGQGVIRNG